MEPIVPERDERIGSRSDSRPRSERPQNKSGNRAPQRSASGGGFWKLLVLVVLLAVVAVGYYAYQQSQKLSTLQASFDELQGKLASTDESLSQSGAALSIKLKDHDAELKKHWSEIRKLWGVSNDRNKQSIAANVKSIKELKNSAAARQKEVKAVNSQLADIRKSIDTVTSASLSSRLEVEEAMDSMQGLVDRLNRLDASLKQWQTKLNSRVSENEEAIEAIDAYRRRVNQDLLQLKQQLGGQP